MTAALRFRVYYAAVVCTALALLFRAAPQEPAPALMAMAIALGLMLVSEARPVTLPSGGYVTATGSIDLPCIVFLGPFHTAILDIVGTFVMQGVLHRKPMVRVVHNQAIFAIATLAAGLAYTAAGGTPGRFSAAHDLGPVLLAGLVYFTMNSMLVSTVIGLTSDMGPWRVWQRNFRPDLLPHFFSLTLGVLIALVFSTSGYLGVALLAVPFVVVGRTFRLYTEIRTDLKAFVKALSEVLEAVDPYTRQHSMRVAQYAVEVARGMSLSEAMVDEIEYAALVHDLGKIGPQHQQIVQKPGRLTDEEMHALQAHPAVGADIVAKIRTLGRAAAIVLHHHEQPDGRGYPDGLREGQIGIGAHIVHVCDSFDAMTSDRPYRRALSVEAALSELAHGAGTQFDAAVVDCVMRLHREGRFQLIVSATSEDLRLMPLGPRAVERPVVIGEPTPKAA